MSRYAPPLLNLPPEVFAEVVFELAATQPLGPPYAVLPLLQTCRTTHRLAAPKFSSNTVLWSRIFRYKFDSSAVARRAFVPTPYQCVEQLIRYCQSMQIIRSANRFRSIQLNADRDEPDITLDEALMVAVVMMMEDDGRNMRQLEEWAELRQVLWSILRHQLYEESRENDGWAVENRMNSCTLWLMWMTTTEESLKNETPEEQDLIQRLILPFVVMPYRYCSAEAPPHHFNLPLNPDRVHLSAITTIQTVHGEYPVYPSGRTVVDVHYGSRPLMSVPLIAPAAKLLYFAREEMKKMPVPPHFARDREEWIARGNDPNGVGITRADVDEWNWGWAARLPGGAGSGNAVATHWNWGAGNDDLSFARDFRQSESDISITDVERALGLAPVTPVAPPAGSAIALPQPPVPTVQPSAPPGGPLSTAPSLNRTHARWQGKAPHSQLRGPKSKRWDCDWWRRRLCSSTVRSQTRVRYGKVYELGCMDGLWHGRMMMPSQFYFQDLLMNPQRPTNFTPEATFGRLMVLPLYARFQEVHRIVGQGDTNLELGSWDPDEENMNNAWFDGGVGSAQFRARDRRGGGDHEEEVEITVMDERERIRKGVFPCYHNKQRRERGEGLGLGNEAWSKSAEGSPTSPLPSPTTTWVPTLAVDKGGEDVAYDHEAENCDQCEARRRIARQLKREREEEERRNQIFASVGLGLTPSTHPPSTSGSDDGSSIPGGPPSESSIETSSTLDEYDPDLDEWEQFETEASTGPNGEVFEPLPGTHDRAKLATGKCDGVEEIYMFGETDTRHSQAFKKYRFYGRVRSWDGLIGLLRVPIRSPNQDQNDEDPHPENLFFYGYLVGGENFVGTWRIASMDPNLPAWEGPFVMSRRED